MDAQETNKENPTAAADVADDAGDLEQQAVAATDESLAVDGVASAIAFDPAFDSRRRRIFDHRLEAQADANPMIACLAGVNSDLFEFELIIGEKLRQSLAASGHSLEALERHGPLFDLVLRYSKQIAQVTQLELRSRNDSAGGAKE